MEFTTKKLTKYIAAVILLLFMSGCSEDTDSNPYTGTYTGTAESYLDGNFIGRQNNVQITFAGGDNRGELRISAPVLQISQDRVLLSGNTITLPRKVVLGNMVSEEGTGIFQGNKLTFDYILITEATNTNGQTTISRLKKVCVLTKG